MSETTTIIIIVFGILSIILFFKVWRMCNRVSKIKEILEESIKPKRYDYFENSSLEVLMAECRHIKEMAACGKIEEAKYNLKRLEYNLSEDEKRLQKRVNDTSYYMKDKVYAVKELAEYIESVS